MIHRLARRCLTLSFIGVAILGGLLALHRFFDLDICWHLRTGQWILAHGRVPYVDPFAAAARPPAWIDFEWGFQTLAAVITDWIGLAGLQLAVAGLVVTTLLILFLRSVRSPMLLVAAFAFVLTAWQRFLIRPDILSLPILLIAMAWIEGIPRAPRSAPILLAGLTAVAVNLHGSFILIPVLIGAALTGALVDRMERGIVLAHGFALTLSLLAALLNPYGYRIYVLFQPYLRSLVSEIGMAPRTQKLSEVEWTPTWRLLASDPIFPTGASLVLVGTLVFSFARLGRRISWRRLACAGSALALGLSAVRHLLPFGAVALAIIAANERERVAGPAAPGRTGQAAALFPALRLTAAGFAVLLAAGYQVSVLTDLFYVSRDLPYVTGVGFYPDTTPEGAVQWLSEYEPPGELFNNYNSGAYLLYRLYPHVRVYTDSRLIDPARYREVLRAVASPAAFDELVRRDGIGTVVLLHPSPETVTLLPQLAKDARWRMVFRDANTTIHVRTDLPPPVPRRPPLSLPPPMGPAAGALNRFLARFKRDTVPAAELTDALVSSMLGDRERQIEAYRRALARSPGNLKALTSLQQLGAAPN